LTQPAFKPPWAGDAEGPLAAPGKYTVELFVAHDGGLESQGNPQAFTVKPVPTGAAGTDFQAVAEFQQRTSALIRQISGAGRTLGEAGERLRFLDAALTQTPNATAEHFAQLQALKEQLADLRMRLSGDPIRQGLNESTLPSISSRAGQVAYGHWETRQMPTQTFQDNFEIATRDFAQFREALGSYLEELEKYEAALAAAGAPYTRGRGF
jgi:uncharacterized protein YukE